MTRQDARRIADDAARLGVPAEITEADRVFPDHDNLYGVLLTQCFVTVLDWKGWTEVRRGILYGRKIDAPVRFSRTVYDESGRFRDGIKQALMERALFTQDTFERLYATERH